MIPKYKIHNFHNLGFILLFSFSLFFCITVIVLPKLNQLSQLPYVHWYNNDIYYDYSIGVIIAFAFLIATSFMINKRMGFHFVVALMIKMMAVLILSLYIDSIYLPDKDGYFGNGVYNFDHIQGWGFSGTMVMHYFIHYITLVFPPSYYAVKVLFVILSTYGLYFLYLSAERYFYTYKISFFYLLLLSPSAIAWGGEISKDVVMLFFIGAFFYLSSRVGGNSKSNTFFLVVSLFVLICSLLVREWFAAILLPVYIYSIVSSKKYLRNNIIYNFYKFTLLFSIPVIVYFLLNMFGKFYGNIEYYRSAFIGGGSSVDFSPLSYGLYSVVFYPVYLMIFPFLPLIPEGSIFLSISAIVNVLIFTIFLWALKKGWRYVSSAGFEYLLYVLLWSSVYSPFVSNYGTLDRYKLVMYPVLFLYVFVLINSYWHIKYMRNVGLMIEK